MNKLSIKINNFKKAFKEFKKINPNKHWTFILNVFLVLVLFLILFSFYLLYQIKNDQVFQVKKEGPEKQTLINEVILNKTMKSYDLRDEIKNTIKNNPAIYKDPSI